MIDEKKLSKDICNYLFERVKNTSISKLSRKMYEQIAKMRNDIIDIINAQPQADKWIPISERLPEDDNYILVSFENYTLPDIARYEEDENGGAFYPGDEDKSYVSFGLFVNAWRPLPEPYREGDTPCT